MRFRALDFWLSLAMLGWLKGQRFGILLFLMASLLTENGETRLGHATAVPSHDQQTRFEVLLGNLGKRHAAKLLSAVSGWQNFAAT
jgi:hypothetical protein